MSRRENAATGDEDILLHLDLAREQAQQPRAAFESLMRRYHRRIYGLCFRFLRNHHDAEDALQEVFLRAYRGLERFRGESSLYTWLFRIATNTCLSYRGRRREHTELPPDIVDSAASVSDRLDLNQRRETLRALVDRLPDRQRMTLVLRVFEERSHREIAELMGCPVGTSKANYFFALKNLHKLALEAKLGLERDQNREDS